MDTIKIKWTPDMQREISGFGGGYEAACRKMVVQGTQWLVDHPDVNPRFKGLENVYGILTADNQDAKSFERAMMNGISDATGAMHQACVGHSMRAAHIGWDNYRKVMAELDDDKCQALYEKFLKEVA